MRRIRHLEGCWARAAEVLPREVQPALGALLLASGASVFLVLARVGLTGQPKFLSLVWNLFLAWMPLFLAVAAYRARQRGSGAGRLGLYTSLWLIFLPNAPYIVTDLIHLRFRPPIPIWVDMMIIVSFAGTGLLLGFLALYLVQGLVAERFGRGRAWAFTFGVFALTGLGVYIGRFLRWNSWDVLFNPLGMGRDLVRTFGHPFSNPAPFVYCTLFSGLFLVAYVTLYSLTVLGRAPVPGQGLARTS